MTHLTLAHAQALVQGALDAADAGGWRISVAVVDQHGNLTAFARHDGSTLAGVLSSQSKAWTAAATGASTGALQPLTEPGQPIYGLAYAGAPDRPFTPIPGGLPIHTADGVLIGGIGIGGAPEPADDEQIAETAKRSAAR